MTAPARRTLHDPAAEAGALGAMLLSSDAALEVAEIVAATDFHHPPNRKIFTTILRAVHDNQPSDPTSITSVLVASGEIERVGGAGYLLGLVQACATASNGPWHARAVAEMAALRRVEEATVKIAQMLQQPGSTAADITDAAQSAIHAATVERGQTDTHTLNDFIDEEFDHLDAVRNGKTTPGIPTGFRDFDALFKGWMPGRLIIPAGRPGMGKSLASLNWAKNVAVQGHPALIFSMEMTRREVLWRLLSDEASLYIGKFQDSAFTAEEWKRLKEAREEIRKLPIAIDDQASSIAQINTAARRFVQGYGRPGLVVVDYVQRLDVPGKERPDIEVGKNIKALKSLARQLETTVIAVCQLNRGNEARSDKRPQMSDLRDSGQLEQEADAVILIHRKDYYDKEVPEAGEAEFIVAKNRHGPTDTLTLASQLHYSRFKDWNSPDERNAA
jgi:replicative DNA helicase